MIFRTHLILGIFLSLIYLNYFLGNYFFVFGVFIGSIFLDVDSYTSRVGKRFLSRVVTSFTKHRGIIHSLLFVLVLSFLVGLVNVYFAVGFFSGSVGHLLLDSITKQGVRMFYPFKFKIKGPFKSGMKFDSFLFILLTLGSGYFFISLLLKIYSTLL